MRRVTVITADVIGSRNLTGQMDTWKRKVSGMRSSSLLTPFELSRGDEIQAVTEGWLQNPGLVRRLRYVLRPAKIRVGLGIGLLDDVPSASSPWDLSGPPFILAREALETCLNSRGSGTAVKSGNETFDLIASAMWSLVDAIQGRWTDGQWEAVQAYDTEGTYKKAAELLGVGLTSIAKRCRAARWETIKQAEVALRALGEQLACVCPPMGENDHFALWRVKCEVPK
ncbi:MAG: hypothetical protein HPY55_05845 [Firmicutes bacterium]|nr:hypothetical protein [Bacillota bacterium]